MPIGRYFLCVGSLLLTLLSLADWYLPPPGDEQSRSRVDPYTIRVHSAHRWPKAVVFDTTQPIIVPPPVMAAVEARAAKPARDAYAMVTEPVPLPAARPAEVAKPAKPHVRRTRTAHAPNNRFATNTDMFGTDWLVPPRREASASGNRASGSRGFRTMSW